MELHLHPSKCLQGVHPVMALMLLICKCFKFYVLLTVHLDILCSKKPNQMHYLSLTYFVNQPVYVSGMFIAYHQEVFIVYVQQ
jgi:hypothetical protein